MTLDQIQKAVLRYKKLLLVPSEKQDTRISVKPTETQSLKHIAWMCDAILAQLAEGNISKAERWLCFIQGVLWVNGLATIDSMREDNRDSLQG